MAISSKLIKKQLLRYKYNITNRSLDTCRSHQELLGRLIGMRQKSKVIIHERNFPLFKGAMVIPKHETKNGVMLYLHGGGYIYGGIDYAVSIGSIFAEKCNVRVFCAAYRLAPEHQYPAALEDALTSYLYLISSGYKPEQIIFCGESAGGGLVYSLCLYLKAWNIPLSGGVISISPWSDLTLSGDSYNYNKEADPSMTKDELIFYANCYTDDKLNPFVSPLYGDFAGFPSSLIFAGGSEIMLEDAKLLHDKLLSDRCTSRLIVMPGMWHGYVLYCLKENRSDFKEINIFLNSKLEDKPKLMWMHLDNAAKIFPAAYRRNSNHVFRLSATLFDVIDKTALQTALDATVKRFPTIAVKLKRGMFWYYLEEINMAPVIEDEKSYPIARMPFDNIRKCAFRVLVFNKRIAVEFFHALTDGNGGLVFLKTLVAEYLKQRYGVEIPSEEGVLNSFDLATEEETQDSFPKYAGETAKNRDITRAYRLKGTIENDGYLNTTTFLFDTEEIRAIAKKYRVTITEFMSAVLLQACYEIQNKAVPGRYQKPLKILIPVNLRKIFNSKTLRNFALFVTPGINPQMGCWCLEEICKSIHHQMGLLVNEKEMSAVIASNIKFEQVMVLRLMPLFIKNLAMKVAHYFVSDGKSCLALSNLGAAAIPDEMKKYVDRFDFLLGASPRSIYNCGMISFEGLLCLNFVRSIQESILEQKVYEIFRSLGIQVKVEGNRR
jgi:acetyl esterase/lipase/NRPS condensation-like uncharacterized protein